MMRAFYCVCQSSSFVFTDSSLYGVQTYMYYLYTVPGGVLQEPAPSSPREQRRPAPDQPRPSRIEGSERRSLIGC